MDAAPPNPPYVYAASDSRPRDQQEIDLCDRASRPDWAYGAGLVLLDVATMYSDAHWLKKSPVPGIRMIGPALAGFTLGATIGGGYLALPKCSRDWAGGEPPEGSTRSGTEMALALGLFASVAAPVALQLSNGGFQRDQGVSTEEQSLRIIVAGGTAFLGSLVPYLLPPRTWRAAKELENLRVGADAHGSFVSYTLNF